MNAILAKYLKKTFTKTSSRITHGITIPQMCCNRFKILKKTHIATYDRPATRLSASTIITSKKPDTIISKIFQV